MSDVKRLLAEATPLPWRIVADEIGPIVPRYATKPDAALIVYAVNRLPDYEAAVGACHEVIDLIDTGSISFEDDDLVRGASLVALARAALARLRESVPA